jgi:hypothetical protein
VHQLRVYLDINTTTSREAGSFIDQHLPYGRRAQSPEENRSVPLEIVPRMAPLTDWRHWPSHQCQAISQPESRAACISQEFRTKAKPLKTCSFLCAKYRCIMRA